jgi:hypothetical protein
MILVDHAGGRAANIFEAVKQLKMRRAGITGQDLQFNESDAPMYE